jgi:hypothetical protein
MFCVCILGALLRDTFIAHYDAIRAVPLFKASTVIYVFENNLGHEHDHLKTIAESVARMRGNCYVLFEHAGVVGFHTTPQSRLAADDRMRELVEIGAVGFADKIICINRDPSKGADAMKRAFVCQMADMREYAEMQPNGEMRRVVTSLFSEDKIRIRGKHDDLQRAFALLLYAHNKFIYRRLPDVNYTLIQNLQANRLTSGLGLEALAGLSSGRSREKQPRRDPFDAGGPAAKRARLAEDEDYIEENMRL